MWQRRSLTVHVFRDPHFAPAEDTVVCLVRKAQMERFITQEELLRTCGRYAVYWREDWLRFVYMGVWGARKGSRLRRLLRARGAELRIKRHPPPRLRLVQVWKEDPNDGQALRVGVAFRPTTR